MAKFVLGLAALFFCACQSEAATCNFELMPTEKSGPIFLKSEFFKVIGAEESAPFSMEFEAYETAWFQWYRFAVGDGKQGRFMPSVGKLDLKQRLEIWQKKEGSPEFQPFCSTDWVSHNELPNFGALKLPADVPSSKIIWNVKLFQKNLTPQFSTIEEDLSEVALRGNLNSSVLVTPRQLTFRPSMDLLNQTCSTNVPTVPPDIELIQKVQLPTNALNVPGSIYALSGRRIFLKVNRIEPNDPVSLHFTVKSIGQSSSPTPICSASVTQDIVANGGWISATIPWAPIGDTMRWSAIFNGNRPSPEIDFELYRDRSPSRSPEVDTIAADVFTCAESSISGQEPAPNSWATFYGAYALTIKTGLQDAGVDDEEYRHIVRSVLVAINTWRSACNKCTPYQFSVVAIDNDVYVPKEMLKGSPENYRATFLSHYPWSNFIGAFSVGKLQGPFTSATSYVKVSNSIRQRSRFCNQLDESSSGFSARSSPLCRPSKTTNENEMIINLEWISSPFPCEQKPGVVACWNGTDLIKINLHEFSFYAGDVGNVLIGASSQQVDLIRVFTHEVGHWLGLKHIDSGKTIMSERFGEALCVDNKAVEKLNNIAIGIDQPSFDPEALLYE